MNTIMAYLDNMFNGLPRTAEVNRIKQDLLSGMEEKYYELKSQGKSENEAVGIVISEFGNIDELKSELGITPQTDKLQLPELTEQEVHEYITAKRKNGFWIGIGVFLILLGVSFLICVVSLFEPSINSETLSDIGNIIGISGLFVFIGIAVTIFIIQDGNLKRFDYLEQGFKLSYYINSEVKQKQLAFARTYRASIIFGVLITILSPIIIFLTILLSEEYAQYMVSIFLLVIAAAVFIFIYYGSIQDGYTKLLEDHNKINIIEKKEAERIVAALNSILWTLATALFLYTGLVNNAWDINWIIFVIAAILSGSIGSVVVLLKNKNQH